MHMNQSDPSYGKLVALRVGFGGDPEGHQITALIPVKRRKKKLFLKLSKLQVEGGNMLT